MEDEQILNFFSLLSTYLYWYDFKIRIKVFHQNH